MAVGGPATPPPQASVATARAAAAANASGRTALLRDDREDEFAQATLPVWAEGGVGQLSGGVEDDEARLPDEAVRASERVARVCVTVHDDELDLVAVLLLQIRPHGTEPAGRSVTTRCG